MLALRRRHGDARGHPTGRQHCCSALQCVRCSPHAAQVFNHHNMFMWGCRKRRGPRRSRNATSAQRCCSAGPLMRWPLFPPPRRPAPRRSLRWLERSAAPLASVTLGYDGIAATCRGGRLATVLTPSAGATAHVHGGSGWSTHFALTRHQQVGEISVRWPFAEARGGRQTKVGDGRGHGAHGRAAQGAGRRLRRHRWSRLLPGPERHSGLCAGTTACCMALHTCQDACASSCVLPSWSAGSVC